MRKKIALALAGLALLTGCGAENAERNSGSVLSIEEVALPDGRTVTCIYYTGYRTGASLSCDWEGEAHSNE